jgi:D-glycero-alpha-D-manno-heptose-7-phosphate kinase
MKIKAIAPSRISLFGGGTDLEPYASTYGGLVINAAINLRQQVVMYSGDDLYEVSGTNVFPYKADPKFAYQILDEFGINDFHQTKLTCTYDALIESGLGSSASAAVALIGAINKRKGLGLSPAEIAEKAWELEVKKIGLYGGKQDQYVAALGGVNVMEFRDKVVVAPLAKGFIDLLAPYFVLLYTGFNRKSSVIQEGFKHLSKKQIEALDQIKSLALNAIDPIGKGDYLKVGEMLDWAWQLKKESNEGVSNPTIDSIYEKAIKEGAIGGKVLGAGGGGFMLFIVPPEKQKSFIKKMGLDHWDFSIDWNGLEVRDITDK